MAEVKILVQGYASDDGPEAKACSTITLVKDKDVVMVVDPGTVESQEVIETALEKEGLIAEDINWVCITHSHIDHYRNIGMFKKAKALEYFGIWDKDNDAQEWSEQFTNDIRIKKTPGHSYDSITLFVTTPNGVIAICGDVFWKKNYPEIDPYASDPEELENSRRKVLEMADFVVPGHGEMFKT